MVARAKWVELRDESWAPGEVAPWEMKKGEGGGVIWYTASCNGQVVIRLPRVAHNI